MAGQIKNYLMVSSGFNLSELNVSEVNRMVCQIKPYVTLLGFFFPPLKSPLKCLYQLVLQNHFTKTESERLALCPFQVS